LIFKLKGLACRLTFSLDLALTLLILKRGRHPRGKFIRVLLFKGSLGKTLLFLLEDLDSSLFLVALSVRSRNCAISKKDLEYRRRMGRLGFKRALD
jgi:hypothetical protein